MADDRSGRTWRIVRRGLEAGLVASVPQVLVTKAEERMLLPANEHTDLGPQLVDALAAKLKGGAFLREDERWLAASAFHFGYAAAWGVLYGLVHERWPLRPWLGGALLGGLIWTITFPRWGGAVLTGAEKPPRERSRRREIVLATAPAVFGLVTGLVYGRGPDDPPGGGVADR